MRLVVSPSYPSLRNRLRLSPPAPSIVRVLCSSFSVRVMVMVRVRVRVRVRVSHCLLSFSSLEAQTDRVEEGELGHRQH